MTLDLTEEETAALARLLTNTIDADHYPLSPRIQLLKCVSAPTRDPTINRLKLFNCFVNSPRVRGPIGADWASISALILTIDQRDSAESRRVPVRRRFTPVAPMPRETSKRRTPQGPEYRSGAQGRSSS